MSLVNTTNGPSPVKEQLFHVRADAQLGVVIDSIIPKKALVGKLAVLDETACDTDKAIRDMFRRMKGVSDWVRSVNPNSSFKGSYLVIDGYVDDYVDADAEGAKYDKRLFRMELKNRGFYYLRNPNFIEPFVKKSKK
jgi:hypothetical protein